MELFEHEAKRLFAILRIPTPRSQLVTEPEAAAGAVEALGGEAVLKVQVLSGGRGKAGGIRKVKTADALHAARDLFDLRIGGNPVDALLVEEALTIARESYLAVTVDRRTGEDVVLYNPDGGVDVESASPSGFCRLPVPPLVPLHLFECERFFRQCGLAGRLMLQHALVLRGLVRLYRELKAELIEVNPLVVTERGQVVAADAKAVIDPSAAWKIGPDAGRRRRFTSPLEERADELGFTFIDLKGDVAIFSVGAGLGMLTMDTIARRGGRPANFIDFHASRGGTDWTYDGMLLVLEKAERDPGVGAILIMLSLTVTPADTTVSGIVKALQDRPARVPVVACVHVGGMGAEPIDEAGAAYILSEAGVAVHTDFTQAVDAAVGHARAVRR